MEIKKLFEESVKEVVAEFQNATVTGEKLGNKLYSIFLAKLGTPAYPDEVIEKQGLVGMPRLVARKALPEPVRDAWGGWVRYDEVMIDKAKIAGIVEEDLCLIKYSTTIEEAKKQQYRFLILTQQEMDEAIDLLEQYIVMDVEDIHGPVLGAMYCIDVKDDTGNAEWDTVVKKIKNRN